MTMRISRAGVRACWFSFALVIPGLIVCLVAADGPWPWRGSPEKGAVSMLLLGDFNVQKRSEPSDALVHVQATLSRADLVYANLEGLLVKSAGPARDLPDKTGWQHLGPEAVLALEAGNVKVVGVANNVAYGHQNIMKSLSVLDESGIAHTGAGRNIEQAHKPAIVSSKGMKFGFLQYTSKWYEEANQIATANTPGVARMLSQDGATVDPSDLERMRLDIRRLRPLADVVIVSSHTRDGQGRSNAPAAAAPARTVPGEPDYYSQLPVNPRLEETEAYQKELAHAAIDAGADVVYGHGCHMLQGVEIYKDKPILYCMGNFASDWIRVRKYKEGMVARVLVAGKSIRRVSLVPVTRDDATNDVVMLDPASGEGARLIEKVRRLSPDVKLMIDGQEAVLIEKAK
jgi:poly-gamma-glutamate capsule biosynthesis protein CapA/YwtB (metallophosphatase superfamily)